MRDKKNSDDLELDEFRADGDCNAELIASAPTLLAELEGRYALLLHEVGMVAESIEVSAAKQPANATVSISALLIVAKAIRLVMDRNSEFPKEQSS